MNNRDIALEFLNRYWAGEINGLTALLAGDLRFRGSLRRCDSRASYLESLNNDPPETAGYRVIILTKSSDSVSVHYEYQKEHGIIAIAQLFKFRDGRIGEILLVFDSGELK